MVILIINFDKLKKHAKIRIVDHCIVLRDNLNWFCSYQETKKKIKVKKNARVAVIRGVLSLGQQQKYVTLNLV